MKFILTPLDLVVLKVLGDVLGSARSAWKVRQAFVWRAVGFGLFDYLVSISVSCLGLG